MSNEATVRAIGVAGQWSEEAPTFAHQRSPPALGYDPSIYFHLPLRHHTAGMAYRQSEGHVDGSRTSVNTTPSSFLDSTLRMPTSRLFFPSPFSFFFYLFLSPVCLRLLRLVGRSKKIFAHHFLFCSKRFRR